MSKPKKGVIHQTRIVKLQGHHDVMFGQDLGKMFEDGMVYTVSKIMGEFIITPIGKSAHVMVANERFPSWKSDPRKKSQILMDATTYITEEEYKAEKQHHISEY